MQKPIKVISLLLRIIAAFIMLQTLYFKFSGAPESVYIFSQLGMEPAGRIATGIGEFIASVLLLIPSTTWVGAIMAIGMMSGAIFFHFTTLGIEIMGDGGQLFTYAMIVLVCSGVILTLHRNNLFSYLRNHKLIK